MNKYVATCVANENNIFQQYQWRARCARVSESAVPKVLAVSNEHNVTRSSYIHRATDTRARQRMSRKCNVKGIKI